LTRWPGTQRIASQPILDPDSEAAACCKTTI